jgi:hypothetical protein
MSSFLLKLAAAILLGLLLGGAYVVVIWRNRRSGL